MTTATPTIAERLAELRGSPGITPLSEAKEALRDLVVDLLNGELRDARPSELDALYERGDRITDAAWDAAIRVIEGEDR